MHKITVLEQLSQRANLILLLNYAAHIDLIDRRSFPCRRGSHNSEEVGLGHGQVIVDENVTWLCDYRSTEEHSKM